jgi:hypothetical protein
MSTNRTWSTLLAGLVAGASSLGWAAAAGARPSYREGEVIVRFETHLAAADMAKVATAGHGSAQVARSLAAVGRPHTILVRFSKTIPVEQMVAKYRAMPGVVAAEPNYVGRLPLPRISARAGERHGPQLMTGRGASPLAAVAPSVFVGDWATRSWEPNDPDYHLTSLFFAVDQNVVFPDKAPCPLVAVLGSGVDSTTPDLVGRVVKGNDWVNDDKDPDDDYGFGTHEAGIIAAGINNRKGIAGISNGKVLAIKVADSQGFWTVFDAAAGILDAAANPLVKVVVSTAALGYDDPVVRDAVQTAVNNGKLVIASTGILPYVTGPQYPAFYSDPSFPTLSPSVIAVAASGLPNFQSCPGPNCSSSTDFGCLASWSNPAGASVFWPGVGVYSTTPTHPFWLNTQFNVSFGYAYLEGETEPAAGIAGAAARAFAVMPEGTTAAQVKTQLVSTGWAPVPYNKTVMVDTDGDGTPDTPCQPAAMSDTATYPDLATIMGRHAISGWVFEANTANTLPKTATVSALFNGKVAAKATIAPFAKPLGRFFVIDVPGDNVTPYQVQANVPAYTQGPVTYASVLLDDCGGGTNSVGCIYKDTGGIGLPKNVPGRYHVVTNWAAGSLETHVFTPSAGPIACDVGMSQLSSLFCWLGSLTSAPFVRLLHHGGTDPNTRAGFGDDLISLKAPLYPTSGTPYEIFLTDSGSLTLPSQGAITRIWTGGKIIGTVDASQGDSAMNGCDFSGGGGTVCDVFYVGDLSQAGTFTPKGIYGTASVGPPGVLPYTMSPRPLGGPRTR